MASAREFSLRAKGISLKLAPAGVKFYLYPCIPPNNPVMIVCRSGENKRGCMSIEKSVSLDSVMI